MTEEKETKTKKMFFHTSNNLSFSKEKGLETKENEIIAIKNGLIYSIKNKIPIFLLGNVGVGKTELVKEIAKELNMELVMVHLARSSNSDFIAPIVENGRLKFVVNDVIKNLEEGNKILYLDEYDRSLDGSTRNAILSLINERMFDGVKLPDNVAVVLAGNQNYSNDTVILNQAEKSRFGIWKITAEGLTNTSDYFLYWLNVAINKLNLDERITTFLINYPELLYNENKDAETEQFATPRSWANLSKLMPYIDTIKSTVIRNSLVSGFIGKEAGSRFLTFVDVFSKMPPAEKILNDFDNCGIKTIDEQLSAVEILIGYSKQNPKKLSEVIKLIHTKMYNEMMYNFIEIIKNNSMLKDKLISLFQYDDEIFELLKNPIDIYSVVKNKDK